jgi:hypothetical protein
MMHTHGSAPRFSGDARAGGMLSPAPEKLRQPDPPATSLAIFATQRSEVN